MRQTNKAPPEPHEDISLVSGRVVLNKMGFLTLYYCDFYTSRNRSTLWREDRSQYLHCLTKHMSYKSSSALCILSSQHCL